MFMADNSNLRDLELQIWGYDAALRANGIQDDFIGFNLEFGEYVFEKMNWSTNCGWALAITHNSNSPELAVEQFFNLANDFFLQKKGINNAIDETTVK